MKYSDIKKVVVVGIGGKGAYYIAKFLLLLGVSVEGYDIKENERTKDLESLGLKINYRNPNEGESFNCDFYLYSNDLPQKFQKIILDSNKNIKSFEVGDFCHQIIDDYEFGNMSEIEINAFKKSNIAPLFEINDEKMRYISVTGTDGKTTTCSMIYHILKNNGYKVALITTVGAYIGDEEIDTGFHTTTPTSQELFALIKKTEDAGCSHIIIESTSHGLEQGRLSGIKFDSVGYTNITSEHLDYHKTWENYCNAKGLLITRHLKNNGHIVLNKDDKSYEILSNIAKNFQSYSFSKDTDISIEGYKENNDGLDFVLKYKSKEYEVSLPILGKYNISNFMCALGICINEGINLENIIRSISSFQTVKGRMQVLQKNPYTVIVDYAHTPNAVLNVLQSARLFVKENSKLIHVFGCAGQRDFYKRYEMGKISKEFADISILTAEDSRLESLSDINDEIERGWESIDIDSKEIFRFDDDQHDVKVRIDAIKKAIDLAKEGDVVIITGKAHESSLCFGQIEYQWSDIEETKKILN